jgi:ElaB/YqjD/DUF883 family membrane-anchored ribosome-binding protein
MEEMMTHYGSDEDIEQRHRNDEALQRLRQRVEGRSTPVHLNQRYLDQVAEDYRREKTQE